MNDANFETSWLKHFNASIDDCCFGPDDDAAMIRERLATAMDEMDALTALLEGDEVTA